MAIAFVEPKVATLTFDVNTNAAGNIAQSGENAAGKKTLSLNGFKAGGTGTNAETVLTKIISNIAGATFIPDSVTKKTVSKVEVSE